MAEDFVHLHGHTQASLQDAVSTTEETADIVVSNEQGAVAVTDHGVMSSSFDQYQACLKKGVKPIIGCETYICQDMLDKTGKNLKDNPNRTSHLVLLAYNRQGLRNLIKMTSLANTVGTHYKPRIDYDLLYDNREGLIALSACLGGVVNRFILNDDIEGALNHSRMMDELMGRDNFYLELQDHGIKLQHQANDVLRDIAHKTGIPTVVTNDFHYCKHEDWEHHCAHVCAGQGNKISDGKYVYDTKQFWIKSSKDMWDLFGKTDPEALENTVNIANRCNVIIESGQYKMPDFPVPPGETISSYMRKLAWAGLELRGGQHTLAYVERLKYELNMIDQMGFPGYFLIVSDYIGWARSNGIPVGPGRGSAAGSLVAYCLEITDVDPMIYNLLFERFLNPSRVSMPDIDVDFCIDGRGKVVEYVAQKYGYDKVARIGTVNTLGVKQAIKDTARVLDLSFDEANAINKLVPMPKAGIAPTFSDVLAEGSEVTRLMKVNPRVRQVIELATKLGPKFKGGKTIDGISKSVSEHASAVIISPEPLNEIVPVRKNKDVNDSIVTTDWTADPCEALGLLKMDFLGLRNLTVMAIALRYIKESTGDVINLRTIPLDDPKVYKLLGEGDVLGIFQLEASAGMGGICRKIAPKNLEDIGAIIALYRPGPMGSGIMDDYIKRRNNEVEWEYFDDRMIPFTETTFGCMVYQEQVMQASVALCGYTLPDADNLRKIIGKKLVDKVEAEKKKLIAGAVANGMIEEKAQQLADMIEKFGEYGFNKSHSIAYGKITYETAWLKANYPVHYMAALLSSVAGKKARVYGYIHNCREMGIQVLPPDVNYSGEDFTVIGDTIRFGLAAVKSVATKAVEAIIETRGRVGFFRDLNHLYQLLGTSVCNAKTMESLILAGCFDSMGVHRAALLEQYPKIVESMKGRDKKNKKQLPGQTVLFRKLVPNTELSVPVPDVEPFDRMKELAGEKALIGVYVSGHPIEKYATSAKVFNTIDLSVFKSDDEEKIEGMEIEIEAEIETDAVEKPVYNDGDTICVVGIVVKSEKKTSKAGKAYMTAELENLDGSIKLLMFNKTFEEYADLLCEDDIVIIVGKLKLEDGKPSVFVNKVKHLENASMLFVNIPPGIDTTKLYGLKSIASKGLTPVVFTFQEYPDKYIVAHPDSWIDMKPDTMARLLKLCPDLSMEDRKCTNG